MSIGANRLFGRKKALKATGRSEMINKGEDAC
jgi:hypothetical protein